MKSVQKDSNLGEFAVTFEQFDFFLNKSSQLFWNCATNPKIWIEINVLDAKFAKV